MLVVNTSGTLAASIDAVANGQPAALHLSGRLPGGLWMVELRHRSTGVPAKACRGRLRPALASPRPARPASGPVRPATPWLDAEPATIVHLPGGGRAQLCLPAWAGSTPGQVRLWVATLQLPDPVLPYLARYGQPIRYCVRPARLVHIELPDRIRGGTWKCRNAKRGAPVQQRGDHQTGIAWRRGGAVRAALRRLLARTARASRRRVVPGPIRPPPLRSTPPNAPGAGSSRSAPPPSGPSKPSPIRGALSTPGRDGPSW